MFRLSFSYGKHNEEGNVVDAIAIRFSNCSKEKGLHLKDTTVE